MDKRVRVVGPALALMLLGGCGGGGGNASSPTAAPVPNAQGTTAAAVPPSNSSTVAASLVSSVPPPAYTGAYASEKVDVLNRLNDDRARCGFGKMAQNAALDRAAQAHADYLAINNLSTHDQVATNSGFTGAGPLERIAYQGYSAGRYTEDLAWYLFGPWFVSNGYPLNEVSAVQVLRNLYATVYHLAGLMSQDIEVGIGVQRRIASNGANGKLLVVDSAVPSGADIRGQQIASDSIATYPCDGSSGLFPVFRSENPDPFPGVDRDATPYGHPIYLMGALGKTVVLNSGSVRHRASGRLVPSVIFTAQNDPQHRLTEEQAFLVPTEALSDNALYDVELAGANTGMVTAANPNGGFTRRFSFTTGSKISD
jgi:hypothetical protein